MRFDLRKFFLVAAIGLAFLLGIGFARMFYLAVNLGVASAQSPASTTSPVLGVKEPAPNKEPATKENVDEFVRKLNSDLDVKYNNLAKAMEAAEKRMSDLQALLAVLAGIGAFLGIAAGVSSYFNFGRLQDDARETVRRVREDLERSQGAARKAVDDITASYPAIANMNEALGHIVSEIGDQLSVTDGWDPDLYSRISETKRQEIAMSETTFAALDFFDYKKVPALSRDAAKIHVALGRFYGSRYVCSTPGTAAGSAGRAAEGDDAALHRAIAYAKCALTTSDDAEVREKANADLGVFLCWQSETATLEADKEVIRRKARGALQAAREKRKHNPASLLALAWIDRRENSLLEAIRHVTELIDAAAGNKLLPEEKTRHLYDAYFNRACYRVLECSAKDTPEKERGFQLALKDLRSARRQAMEQNTTQEWLSDLRRDLKEFESSGDLAPLKRSHWDELQELQQPSQFASSSDEASYQIEP